MLLNLAVKNYVLIDELEISFDKGLTIVTGETGAGKSILLGALGLILGQRADSESLLDKKQKCIVEGVFNISEYKLKSWFTNHELDYQEETTIRREINAEGKSRAFINDTPVNLSVLKELTIQLVDIHSQHETLSLNNSLFQLNVVDAYARNKELLNVYQQLYKEHQQLAASLKEDEAAELKGKADADYFQFQFNELESAKLIDREDESLEQEQKTLAHAEEIRIQLNKALSELEGNEQNLLGNLSAVQQQLSGLTKYGTQYEEISTRLKSSIVELKDIASELEAREQEISLDPERLQIVDERLNLLYKLQQKHQVKTVKELLLVQNDFSEKLLQIGSLEENIRIKKEALNKLAEQIIAKGNKITEARKKVIPAIEKEITKQLSELAMPHAVFRIAMHPVKDDQWTQLGFESVQFLFSANKGIEFRELNKVASGGELSRVMLCVKSLLAKLTAMPTIIFDEIDTGVSGETAFRIGNILQQMSHEHQVMAITHLPQIASKGSGHYLVYKEVKKSYTRTRLKELNKEERVEEIARMLSGEQLSEAALSNARELLMAN